MSKEKEYTSNDVISILDFAKDKKDKSKNILLNWMKNRNNQIEKDDEYGLSVVGIFEYTLTIKDKEVGKIIMFNYKGVGGGWHNDIYEMVEKKYFSDSVYYRFIGDGDGFYYRFFLTDVFNDESFNQWDRPKNTDDFRVFKQELPNNSELIIIYDTSDNRDGVDLKDSIERTKDYTMYYDYSACTYYIKNIHNLEYKPSKPIIEEIIKKRNEI